MISVNGVASLQLKMLLLKIEPHVVKLDGRGQADFDVLVWVFHLRDVPQLLAFIVENKYLDGEVYKEDGGLPPVATQREIDHCVNHQQNQHDDEDHDRNLLHALDVDQDDHVVDDHDYGQGIAVNAEVSRSPSIQEEAGQKLEGLQHVNRLLSFH